MDFSQKRLEIEQNRLKSGPFLEISKISKFLEKFNKFKKNINLHLSQKRLEIEQNGNLGMTFTANVHSETFFNISKNLII